MMTQLLSWDQAASCSELIKPPGLQSSYAIGSQVSQATPQLQSFLQLPGQSEPVPCSFSEHIFCLLSLNCYPSNTAQWLSCLGEFILAVPPSLKPRETLNFWFSCLSLPNSCDNRPVLRGPTLSLYLNALPWRFLCFLPASLQMPAPG